MTKEELNNLLSSFSKNKENLLAEIYFILKRNEETNIRFVDLESESQIELTKQFVGSIETEILSNDDLGVIPISNADDRTNVIYEYDLDEKPQELDVIDYIVQNEDLPVFSFNIDKLEDIKGIMVLISNEKQNLVFYKQHYPISLYRKDGFSIKGIGNDTRFVRLTEDIVKVNPSFEFFKLNNTLFINNLKTLEKFFGFHNIIRKKAEECIEEIRESEILENPDVLSEMTDDITFARKLTKVKNASPVLGKIPSETIITFVRDYPSLKGKFDFNEDNNKILLSTKRSKELFVKLLNDDFLQSELTKLYYDSLAKDTLVSSS